MSGPWIVVVIALWLTVIVLAAFVVGLGKRALPLLERLSDHVADGQVSGAQSVSASSLQPGAQTPELPDFYRGQTGPSPVFQHRLVLFVEAGCEPCAVLVADLRRRRIHQGNVELVAVVDDAQFAQKFPDQWSVIIDDSHRVTVDWQVRGTPSAVLTTASGQLIRTYVPNSRKDLETLLARQATTGEEVTHQRAV